MRVLLVSSFVRPHVGGVEEFVDSIRTLLREQGADVRVLACRLTGEDTTADVVVSTRFVGPSGWPLPTGGWRVVRREVSAADVVIVNNARQALPVLAAAAARLARRPALFVLHGSGEGAYAGRRAAGIVRGLFQRTLGWLAVRLASPVSVSRVGVEGAQRLYGVQASYLPYPLRELPPASPSPPPAPGEALRVVWVGRLSPEKNPALAVHALDRFRVARTSELYMCGDGPLRSQLDELAPERPWLSILGARSWAEVQDVQAGAHVCLSTSVLDNVQVALLEALCRGIPAVATRVGDAPAYFVRPALRRFCVSPGDRDEIASALETLAASYARYCHEFQANAALLLDRHRRAGAELERLVRSAVPGGLGAP